MTNGGREARATFVDRALEVLDPEARAALWLYIGENESIEEVAACLGIGVWEGRQLAARGIRMLRASVRRSGAGIGHRSSLRASLRRLPEKDPPSELWEKTRRAAASVLRDRGFPE